MGKPVYVLAALLAAALAWAYVVAHPGAGGLSRSGEEVAVWEIDLRKITKIVFQQQELKVEITPRWSEGEPEPYLWVETQHRPPAPRAKGAPKEPPPLEHSRFKGNSAAGRLLKELADFRSPRRIGPLEKLDGKEFGFPAKEHWLEVQRGEDKPLRVELGGTTHGERLFYGYSLNDRNVYILPRQVIVRLQRARTGLLDATLFPFPVAKTQRIDLTLAGQRATVWHLEDIGQGEPAWGRQAGDKTGVAEIQAFVERLSKIRVREYAAPEGAAKPALPALPALELVLYPEEKGGKPAWLKVFEGDEKTVRAETSHTGAPVHLPRGQVDPLINQARRILKGS